MSLVKLSRETTPTIPQGLCESPPCSVGTNVQYPARGTDGRKLVQLNKGLLPVGPFTTTTSEDLRHVFWWSRHYSLSVLNIWKFRHISARVEILMFTTDNTKKVRMDHNKPVWSSSAFYCHRGLWKRYQSRRWLRKVSQIALEQSIYTRSQNNALLFLQHPKLRNKIW